MVKVSYAGVCGSDVHIYNGQHPIAKTPIILCHEIVGEVVEVYGGESGVKIGEKVALQPCTSCGKCEACRNGNWHVCRRLTLTGILSDGGFAEFVKCKAQKLVRIDDIPMDTAVLTEPLAVGLHVVRRSGLKLRQSVLIIGGGPIGLIIGIMAKIAGAATVVISEGNKMRIKLAKEFGFEVIDAFEDDVASKVNFLTSGEGFDIVYEVTGTRGGLANAVDFCKIRGTIVNVGIPEGKPPVDVLSIVFKELNLVGSRVYTMEDFKDTVELEKSIIKNGTFDLKKLISDVMPLEELPKAMEMMTNGANLSKIIIKL